MNKILVSESFLKNNFLNTLFANAEKLINEKGFDIKIFQNEINSATNEGDFVSVFEKYFGDELKIVK